jgi:thioredoxin reductase (NADPH)
MAANSYDVVVIGSGIAGLTATKHLLQSRPGLKVANFEAEMFGGLVLNINELDGSVEGSGAELASGLSTEALDLGVEMLSESVTTVVGGGQSWTVITGEAEHRARVVIVASGARFRKLGVPGENEFEHRGISHCADCDGAMFAGKDVVVAGGGDSALQEARILADVCRTVYLVNRADRFTAKPDLVAAIEGRGNVVVRHRCEVAAIRGGANVEKVEIRSLADNAPGEIGCSGVFGFIGLVPATDFLPSDIARDDARALVTDASLSAAPRLFAAGAVRSGYGGMLEHAIAEGKLAAASALKALEA